MIQPYNSLYSLIDKDVQTRPTSPCVTISAPSPTLPTGLARIQDENSFEQKPARAVTASMLHALEFSPLPHRYNLVKRVRCGGIQSHALSLYGCSSPNQMLQSSHFKPLHSSVLALP
jgi:hypothetical protein